MQNKAQSQYREFKSCCIVQNEAQSQYSEVLLQSQADLSVGQADEGDTDREIRELSQELVEAQQEVMTAQAECDRALRAEQEAFEAWESKRSAYYFFVCLMMMGSLLRALPLHVDNPAGLSLMPYCLSLLVSVSTLLADLKGKFRCQALACCTPSGHCLLCEK